MARAETIGQDVRVANIVVIEDHQDTAELMCEILRSAGHHVEAAFNGRDGIDVARRITPELVFCDVGLPDMDGYDVARTLRATPALRQARLVAITGFNGDDERERALAAGFDRHVAKPLEPGELVRLADE